jgi:hypothetical protein
MNQIPNINTIKGGVTNNKNGEIIKLITNRVLDLIMIEINKDDMQENIKKRIIHPLLYMLYCQLYPYIYTLIFFILYLKKN